MATGNSGASAQDTETSSVRVNSGGEVKHGFKFPKPKNTKHAFFYLLIVIVILAGGWLLIKKEFHVGEKVYASAGGHNIYESDVKEIIGKTKGISSREAATTLADKYLTEAMGKEYKVSVTDQDIVTVYGKNTLSQKKSQQFYYQQKVNRLYFKKLSAFNQGSYKGEYLITNFSRNVPYPSPLLAEQKAANANLGNPAAIAADKKYAENFITKLYNQIMAHKMTFSQAAQAELNDPQVGKAAYPTQPHSGIFDTSDGGYGSVITADVTKDKIRTIKQGTTTKPFVAGGSNIMAGPYYLVIHMEESKGGESLPYSQFLQQAKQKFGYKVYV
jgi:hypothetical protein